MTRPLVVKLGGSVLTDKTTRNTLRPKVLARLADELAQVDDPLVVVHGAGSFGHVLADEHDLHAGRTHDDQVPAAARLRTDLHTLHHHVLHALQDAGLPAVGLPAFGRARLRDGELETFPPDAFADALHQGFVPVTHGDLALDATRGFGIVSGDALVEALATDLRPRLVAFASDVDGVHGPDGTPLPWLSPERVQEVAGAAGDRVDVTGGMAGKARRIAAVARAGIPVRVVDGSQPGHLAGALTGHHLNGSLITAGGPTP